MKYNKKLYSLINDDKSSILQYIYFFSDKIIIMWWMCLTVRTLIVVRIFCYLLINKKIYTILQAINNKIFINRVF